MTCLTHVCLGFVLCYAQFEGSQVAWGFDLPQRQQIVQLCDEHSSLTKENRRIGANSW